MYGSQPTAARRLAQFPQHLARGGMVRGPGTGTSDSIPDEAEPGTFIMPADSTAAIGPSALEKMGTVPVRLSDGEFKLPPEQVMALGRAVLKMMKDVTHTPVNGVDGGQTDAEAGEAGGFNPADRMAQMPEQLFADGGTVENDVTRIGNSYSGGNVGGNITVNGAPTAGTFSENPAGRMAAMPGSAPAPAAAATPAPDPSPSPVGMSVDQAQRQGLVGARIGYNPAYDQRLTGAQGTPSAQNTAAARTQPAAPMGWAERNAQRNAEVSAASITNRPEWSRTPRPDPAPLAAGFQPASQQMGTMPPMGQPQVGFQPRRYADGGTVSRMADLPPGYQPRGYFEGGDVVDDREQQALANQTAMYVRGAQEAAAIRRAPQQVARALRRAE